MTQSTETAESAAISFAGLLSQVKTREFVLPDDQYALVWMAHLARTADDEIAMLRQLVQRAIVRRAVTDILSIAKASVAVYDGSDYAIRSCRSTSKIMSVIDDPLTDELIVLASPSVAPTGTVMLTDVDGHSLICTKGDAVTLAQMLVSANEYAAALSSLLDTHTCPTSVFLVSVSPLWPQASPPCRDALP